MLPLAEADQAPGPPAVPFPDECVVCFVERMVVAHGCGDRLTWVKLWRRYVAPRATALERRLYAKGGFCDCQVLVNVYVRRSLIPGRPAGEAPPPRCVGVRRGSAQPCASWLPRSRR